MVGVGDGVEVWTARRMDGGSINHRGGRAARSAVAHGFHLGDTSDPVLGTNTASVGHGSDDTEAERMVEEGLQHAPTWRAKCRIQGSADSRKV